MIKIVGVRFRSAGKVYYFNPKDLQVRIGEHVIAETSKGLEYGTISTCTKMVDEELVLQPLRSLVRKATEEDEEKIASLRIKEKEALRICREKVYEHELDMKVVDAEYSFDASKVLFYFTADGRVDFRNLVKDLASVFHVRIELRQIGVRDETRMLGGIGICGRELCCATFLREFQPVSIKMAKEQNLSLNPAKISGTCGRLMCCLKNEEATYEFLNAKMPKLGEEAVTADGMTGKVVELDVLRQRVRVLFEENDTKELETFPVSELTFRPKKKKDPSQQGKKNKNDQERKAEDKGVKFERGKDAEGKSEHGKNAEGKPEHGKNAEGKSVHGKNAEGKPEQGRNAEGKPEQGRNAEGKPEQGRNAEGKPEQGRNAEGKPEQGRNADGKPERKNGEGRPERKNAEGRSERNKNAEGRFERKNGEGRPERSRNAEGKPDRKNAEGKSERRDKSERFEKSAKKNKSERGDRYDRSERGDRFDKSERGDRSDRSERGNRYEKSDRADRKDRTERGDREEWSDRSERKRQRRKKQGVQDGTDQMNREGNGSFIVRDGAQNGQNDGPIDEEKGYVRKNKRRPRRPEDRKQGADNRQIVAAENRQSAAGENRQGTSAENHQNAAGENHGGTGGE